MERRAETVRIIVISGQVAEVVAYTAAAAFRGMVIGSTTTTEEVAGAAPAVMEELGEWAMITLEGEAEEGVAAELLLMVVQAVNPLTAATDVEVMVDFLRLILAVMTATTVRAQAVVVVVASHTTRYWEWLLEMEATAHMVVVVVVVATLGAVAELVALVAAAVPALIRFPLPGLDQPAVPVFSAAVVVQPVMRQFRVDQVMAVSSGVMPPKTMVEAVLALVVPSLTMAAVSLS